MRQILTFSRRQETVRTLQPLAPIVEEGLALLRATVPAGVELTVWLHPDPNSFDIVVTDFNMPKRSGLEVVEQLGALRPGLPVLVTSGSVTDQLRLDLQIRGCADVIEKQNTVEDLVPAIGRVLALRPRYAAA